MVAAALVLAVTAWVRWEATTPDPFGTLEDVKRVADPALVRAHEYFVNREGPLVAEASLRALVARKHFRGDARELRWFLDTLGRMQVPASDGYSVERDDFYSVVLHCISALGEGWDRSGPYASLAAEVEAQAVRFSEHPERTVRIWCGAVLSALAHTGSLSTAGERCLHSMFSNESIADGIRTIGEYRLFRHRQRG
jgi:hypothetical protein